MKTTPKATAPDSRKEGTMNDNKLTILYERLSHEDGRENESLSIEHQKEYLEEYATRNGFTNFVHRTDDGWSGTRWDRPGFLQIMEDIERGNVGQILIKDMSRLGRDHLRVGLFLEQLRERGVRLIAVAEGIDTAMKLGANHPMGPLELGAFIGLDICLAIMDVLYNETGDGKYRACPLIRKMVRGGNLGVKSGKGFYVYNADRTKTAVDEL